MISSFAIFPSESSWGSIYAIIGGMILTAGIYFRLKPVLAEKKFANSMYCRMRCCVIWNIYSFRLYCSFTISSGSQGSAMRNPMEKI